MSSGLAGHVRNVSRENAGTTGEAELSCGDLEIRAPATMDFVITFCGPVDKTVVNDEPIDFNMQVQNNAAEVIVGDARWFLDGQEVASHLGAEVGGNNQIFIHADPAPTLDMEGTFTLSARYENVQFKN